MSQSALRGHASIAHVELIIYAAILLAIVLRGLRNLFDNATDTSNLIRRSHIAGQNEEARLVSGHYQDFYDVEWAAFEAHFLVFTACSLLNASATFILKAFSMLKYRRYTVVIIGFIILITTCGLLNSVQLIAEICLVYLAMSKWNPPSVAWIVGFCHIFVPINQFTENGPLYAGIRYAEVFSQWFRYWNILRYVSFGCEWRWSLRESKRDTANDDRDLSKADPELEMEFTLLDFLGYLCYTPTMFAPIISYRCYYQQVAMSSNASIVISAVNIKSFAAKLAGVTFWLFVVLIWGEMFMLYTTEGLKSQLLSLDAYGAGVITWAHGQYFQAKYMVIYGLPSLVAYLDHGVELTPLPIFISRVYLYSNMWKYFDTGLYDFLKNYIYVLVGKAYGKQIGGAVTFFFIWAWHGTNWTMALWTACNFAEIVVEALIRQACNDDRSFIYKRIRSKMSPSWWRRTEALAGAVAFTFSSYAIAYFLMGYEAGSIIASRTFLPSKLACWIHIAASYCWVQTVFSYENWSVGSVL